MEKHVYKTSNQEQNQVFESFLLGTKMACYGSISETYSVGMRVQCRAAS